MLCFSYSIGVLCLIYKHSLEIYMPHSSGNQVGYSSFFLLVFNSDTQSHPNFEDYQFWPLCSLLVHFQRFIKMVVAHPTFITTVDSLSWPLLDHLHSNVSELLIPRNTFQNEPTVGKMWGSQKHSPPGKSHQTHPPRKK